MSTDSPTPETQPSSPSAMSVLERRVLGVLVEKAKTTPEAYPLSLNALVTGSNQKSNRDPMLTVTDEDVEITLTSLQQKGLVTRITGSRVDRWRHNLYEQWSVEKIELAILAELLLRGPQTEGELRGHASRMEPIADLETLRARLGPLRDRGLVVFLGPEGRRGTQITHGFHEAAELEKLRQGILAETAEPARSVGPQANLHTEVEQVKAELTALRALVSEMQSTLTKLADELAARKP